MRLISTFLSLVEPKHGEIPSVFSRTGWNSDPLVIGCLAAILAGYFAGVRRMSGSKFFKHVRTQAWFFAAGWTVLAVALTPPLHALSDSLFSAHMVQHELLMVVAAPLLVLGRPDLAYLRALPPFARMKAARVLRRPSIRGAMRFLLAPATAWLLHGLALWVWHIPGMFDATLSHAWIHGLQHASFLGTALLFWASLSSVHVGRCSYAAGIIYLFTTALHTTVLGALLTFASSPWYPAYLRTAVFFGLSPLEDQQLGGLIMWVPGGVVYMIVALWLLGTLIRHSDHRSSWNATPTTGN
jgi:cytochrome c oxidase assembly factor CtaG